MTETVKHTPGPWNVRGTAIYGAGGKVAEIPSMATTPGATVAHDKAIANARLMAAAPDLLAACKTLIRFATKRDGTPADVGDVIMTFVEDGSTLNECLDNAAAAIQKAEGM